MDKTKQVSPKFDCTVPSLECKQRRPLEPEICAEKTNRKAVSDSLRVQVVFGCSHQSDEVNAIAFAKSEGMKFDDLSLFVD